MRLKPAFRLVLPTVLLVRCTGWSAALFEADPRCIWLVWMHLGMAFVPKINWGLLQNITREASSGTQRQARVYTESPHKRLFSRLALLLLILDHAAGGGGAGCGCWCSQCAHARRTRHWPYAGSPNGTHDHTPCADWPVSYAHNQHSQCPAASTPGIGKAAHQIFSQVHFDVHVHSLEGSRRRDQRPLLQNHDLIETQIRGLHCTIVSHLGH